MLADYQARCRQRVDAALTALFEPPQANFARLYEAMAYAVMNGGKRIRPLLVYASCEAFGGQLAQADGAACAIELIHAYSLIHDDLPAMDDDDLRRGQPTTHIAFDEATAILAGDALQAMAFEVLADRGRNPHPTGIQLSMICALAQAAGAKGMVGGQMLDLAAEHQALDLTALEQMHRLKTGALIQAAVTLGSLASGHRTQHKVKALNRYAQCIGLAFQVQDDILDVAGDTATLGKRQGADIAHHKQTYPALLGLDAAKAYAGELCQQALVALSEFGREVEPLRELAQFIVQRRH